MESGNIDQTYRSHTRDFTKPKQNPYKNRIGQAADGDYVGNRKGYGQGWLESVPGLKDEICSTDFRKNRKKSVKIVYKINF